MTGAVPEDVYVDEDVDADPDPDVVVDCVDPDTEDVETDDVDCVAVDEVVVLEASSILVMRDNWATILAEYSFL